MHLHASVFVGLIAGLVYVTFAVQNGAAGSRRNANKAATTPLLSCEDSVIAGYGICNDIHTKHELLELAHSYEVLKSSRQPNVPFLAAESETLFHGALSECSGIGVRVSAAAACAVGIIAKKASSISTTSTAATLKDDLKSSNTLELSLVALFPHDFIGVSASWAGDVELTSKSGVLRGEIYGIDRRIHFPLYRSNPTAAETSFFTYSKCADGCFSWWKGKFVVRNGTLTFELGPTGIFQ